MVQNLRYREKTMSDELDFVYIDGENIPGDITVYALSTCGFCKRALEFLQKNSIKFRYIYVDKLPLDMKTKIKSELRNKSGKNVAFPFMVIDDKKYLVGFVENDWKRELLNEQGGIQINEA